MCDMYYIHTSFSCLNSSSHGVDETPMCFLRNRDHALCMMFMRFWYFSFGFLNESNTVTQDRSISITSRIQWKLLIHTWLEEMLDIYTYWLVEVTQKVKRLTWSCTATEWMCDRVALPRTNLLHFEQISIIFYKFQQISTIFTCAYQFLTFSYYFHYFYVYIYQFLTNFQQISTNLL